MMVMRHTERLDDFFPDWIERCDRGYKAFDLNMPMMLPVKRPLYHYEGDPPITNTGDILARIIARGMYAAGYVPNLIYASPSLRCIQTANAMRSILKCDAKIRVEPGLFENTPNTSLYPKGLPYFATPEQRAQFHVDEGYRPYMTVYDLMKGRETLADFNKRIKNTLMRIAKIYEVSPVKKDQIVLIVAHASTVDMAAGLLARSRKSYLEDFTDINKKVPSGSLLVLERVQGRRGWTPNLYAVPPVTLHDFTTEFDASFVLRDACQAK
ncbi:phosphoglycerate mutase family protein [Necator americanus]|nr:phosphoglycerate mutase family protein [Necator americanus]ETN80210.1 phosphoglycerate mutase family protein [Necator americanus]